MTDTTIAVPLDMGQISKDFETTNQFEIFTITPNKVLKQSTVTSPIAKQADTIIDWLTSFGVEKVFIFEKDKKAADISKSKINVVKVPKIESPEKIIWEYVKDNA